MTSSTRPSRTSKPAERLFDALLHVLGFAIHRPNRLAGDGKLRGEEDIFAFSGLREPETATRGRHELSSDKVGRKHGHGNDSAPFTEQVF